MIEVIIVPPERRPDVTIRMSHAEAWALREFLGRHTTYELRVADVEELWNVLFVKVVEDE